MSNTANKLVLNTKDSKSVEKIPQSSGKGKTAKEIMNRHIIHKDDVITDEEFKNLEVGVENSSDTLHEPLDISNDHERPKDEDKDPKIATPWDVIK